MQPTFVHAGFGNFVAAHRVEGVLAPGAAPARRLVQAAAEQNLVIDMTGGRRTGAVLLMDDGHFVLVATPPAEILQRLQRRSG